MIVISNGQRDELVRLIEWACSKADRRDLRGYNMCRRAARIAKGLAAKPEISHRELQALLSSPRPEK